VLLTECTPAARTAGERTTQAVSRRTQPGRDGPRAARRTSAVAAACALCLVAVVALAAPSGAGARGFAPKKGKAYAGVSDTGDIAAYRKFAANVKHHPAVLETFHFWTLHLDKALDRWDDADARGVLSITTRSDTGKEMITPYGIAHGNGDNYPLRLNREIANSHQTVYIRLMSEMNGAWNPYCAFDRSGHFRGKRHSPHQFIQAWRRFDLIVKGGKVAKINRHLHHLGMKGIKGDAKNGHLPKSLPKPKVSMMWVPHSSPTPNIGANQPGRYWPGKRYVDWTGTDIFSRSPNWAKLHGIYNHFASRPFVIGEYGLSAGDNPGFIRKLFGWSARNKRSRMLIYYQGFAAGDPYRIWHYPRAQRRLRHILNGHRFIQYPPGTKHN
jgi:hypothetical protein